MVVFRKRILCTTQLFIQTGIPDFSVFYGETIIIIIVVIVIIIIIIIIIIGFSKAKKLGLHVHVMTAHKRSRGINPLILNLGIRWR